MDTAHASPISTQAARRGPRPLTREFRVLIILGVLSTTVHYAHNFFAASMYPPVDPFFPNAVAYQVGIAIFYPLLTFVLLRGYRALQQGRHRAAGWSCVVYAPLGMTSPGHFLGGDPDIPTVFYATIFTDALTGAAIFAFGVALLRRGSGASRPPMSATA